MHDRGRCDKHQNCSALIEDMIKADIRVGFGEKPSVAENRHGWFYLPHKVIMAALMGPHTKCVLELGSWLGKSTTFICERAPNAHVFAIDLWSNEFVIADDHYTDTTLTDRTFQGSGRAEPLDEP